MDGTVHETLRAITTAASAVKLWHGLAAALFGYWIIVIVYRVALSPLRKIPGPFLGRFSTGWWLWHVSHRADMQWATLEQHAKHGAFVRITHKEISVAHVDAIDILLKAPLEKDSWYKIFSIPDSRSPNQMSICDPKVQMALQKNTASGYALSNLIKAEPFLDQAIQLFERQIEKESSHDGFVALDKWFTFFAFDIVGELTFSERFGFLESGRDLGDSLATNRMMMRYLTVMGHFYQYHDLLMINPLMDYLKLQPLKHVFETADKAIKHRESSGEHHYDMMEHWNHVRNKYPERLSRKDIHSTAIVTVAAGTDTVSAQLQAFMYYLLQNPRCLKRVREELDVAASEGRLSSPVQYHEAQELPYFQACIKETVRFHPIFVHGYPRIVPAGGLRIGGTFFTEGTVLSVNPWVIHRLPAIFGDDADTFVPERWLSPESKGREKFLITFGAGYNACPGRHATNLQLNKLLATLLRDYDFAFVRQSLPWKFLPCFVARPYGWHVTISKRQHVS